MRQRSGQDIARPPIAVARAATINEVRSREIDFFIARRCGLKTKQLRKLKIQFGHLAPALSAEDIAEALETHGLILRLDDGRRYAETRAMRAIPRQSFSETIADILRSAQAKGGHHGQ